MIGHDRGEDTPRRAGGQRQQINKANRLAREAFIPSAVWKRSEAFLRPSIDTVHSLANKLHISPTIIAGRLRREKVGYRNLSRLVGYRQVRRLFDEVKWG